MINTCSQNKSIYQWMILLSSFLLQKWKLCFWNLKILPSAQFTAWRVLCNVIPTKDNLLRRGLLLMSDRCPLCGVEEELVRHLFFECRISWRIWGMCLKWLGIRRFYIVMYKCILGCLNIYTWNMLLSGAGGHLGRYCKWNLEL